MAPSDYPLVAIVLAVIFAPFLLRTGRALLNRRKITHPIQGQLQVVACSRYPDTVSITIAFPRCVIEGVITAPCIQATPAHFDGYGVPKDKWPRSGVVLPVTVDSVDPRRFRIEWNQVLTVDQSIASHVQQLARQLNAQADTPTGRTDGGPSPWVWQGAGELSGSAQSRAGVEMPNGMTPQDVESALSGNWTTLGLVQTTATVLSVRQAGPSSAPGGTWDITVRVSGVDSNSHPAPDWEAVTRMSFSSQQRREGDTAIGNVLPVLVDPNDRRRIIVDVPRMASGLA